MLLMTVSLDRSDFLRIVDIVQKMPDFANVRDRRRLLEGVFQGLPRGEGILSLLDLDGTPSSTSVITVKRLMDYGTVEYGKEALGIFLNYIMPFLGDEERDFVVGLFGTYPLHNPASSSLSLDVWRGTDNLADVEEKIIGENTLKHVYTLQLAIEAAKAVVQVKGANYLGTGFMIAPDVVMTNHHVIEDKQQAEAAEFIFNYQLDAAGKTCEIVTVRSQRDGLFYANQELDFAVIQLENPPLSLFGQPLKLKNAQVRKGDRVSIIQHPGGHMKKISMQNNFVQYADSRLVQYTTSTERGSSGAPVFNDVFEVVAIHHSGGMLVEPQSGHRILRNEGISMVPIIQEINNKISTLFGVGN
jgi:V8-like Glu-specific endopeptidase